MMAWLNWRVWAALALAIAFSATGWQAYVIGGNSVQVKWDAAKLTKAAANLVAEQDARTKERNLQAIADTLRKSQNDEIIKLGISLDAARAAVRVQHSTPRPADYVAPVAGAGAGCSGASLYTQDAEFLIREAGRADAQRLQLETCQTQYNAAYEAVK
ncbi:MAG: hypothetical protein HHJ15_18230 [Rhodoferax sp.]|uniref:hypothetical protein n=1 Tax=Rhodoferax sp. TaxID=50421 RepID=UPI001803CFE5|nr:hypothetical protein [Rhodoferax sp.]NMM21861.1 hypothetical protein [Rhodoferax sp.]